jgi:hypothetical protein
MARIVGVDCRSEEGRDRPHLHYGVVSALLFDSAPCRGEPGHGSGLTEEELPASARSSKEERGQAEVAEEISMNVRRVIKPVTAAGGIAEIFRSWSRTHCPHPQGKGAARSLTRRRCQNLGMIERVGFECDGQRTS